MRACLLLLISACGTPPCDPGTLAVDVRIDPAVRGTALEIDVTADGATRSSRVDQPDGVRSGRVIVTFPRGYPNGADVGVTVSVLDGTALMGSGSVDKTVAAGCDHVLLSVVPAAESDLLDAAPSDMSSGDTLLPTDLATVDLAPEPDLARIPLIVVPASHDYMGVAEGGASAAFDLILQNSDSAPTGLLLVTMSGPDAAQFHIDSESCSQFQLAPAAMCHVMVSFHPSGSGPRSASLLVEDSVHRGVFMLTGLALGADGTSCSTDGYCQSGNCVDGVCCNTPRSSCSGCMACNVIGFEGQCTAVPNGQDPHGTCTGLVCATGKCDGAGACAPGQAGTACQNDGCTGSSFAVHLCTGSALGCPAAITPQSCPGSLVCASSTDCKTSCADDRDCTSGWCNGGVCTAVLGLGQPCTRHRQCSNGDPYRNGATCDRGKCASCAFGVFQGLWGDIAYNVDNVSDGSPICYPTGDGINDLSKRCSGYADGNAACAAAGVGDTCSSGVCHCSSSVSCTSTRAPNCLSDGVGSFCACYVQSSGIPQGAFGCPTNYRCVSNTCKIENGYACSNNAECASGSCVDGLCR